MLSLTRPSGTLFTSTYSVYTLILICILVSGCAAGKATKRSNAAMEAGDYKGATENALIVLEKKPDRTEMQDILQRALPLAVEQMAADAEAQSASTSLQDMGAVVAKYTALVKLNSRVDNLNMVDGSGNPVTIETTDFKPALSDARGRAADGYADYAASLGESATSRSAYKTAAVNAKRALGFVSQHQRASDLYSEFREAATRDIAIGNFYDESVKHVGASGSVIVSNMRGHLKDDKAFKRICANGESWNTSGYGDRRNDYKCYPN